MTCVYVSIGSNVERDAHIQGALVDLRAMFGAVTQSTIYESPAVGFAGDPFYNLVVGFNTPLSAEQVHDALRHIEAQHGRERAGPRYAPRTLDLDLLLYGDHVGPVRTATLPRDEIERHAFVLRPLAEIAPQAIHPVCGRSYQTLWEAMAHSEPPVLRVVHNTQLFPHSRMV